METTIRSARDADADELRALDERTWSPLMTPATRAELSRPFFSPSCGPDDVLVAVRDGALAGYVQLAAPTALAASRHVLEVKGLVVDPAHRRRGVATLLLRAAMREAERRGARRLTLRVLAHNAAARSLYEACGFAVEGVLRGEFLLDGAYVDDVLMALALPPADSSSRIG